MKQLTGIHHIGIYTGNIERSIWFYETVLGFQTLFVTSGKERLAMLERDGMRIELILDPDSAQTAAACQNHLAFSCSDVEACAAQLAAAGIPCENGGAQRLDGFGIPPSNITVLFFRGPSGERIELFQTRA